MARPKHNTPTAAELEVLKILWEIGPSTVRDVMNVLNNDRQRAYTSVMSLLNVMAEKQLVKRSPHGRAFLYEARRPRETTLGGLVQDLLGRAFEGSASSLVTHVLDQSKPTPEELDQIRHAIEHYENGEAN